MVVQKPAIATQNINKQKYLRNKGRELTDAWMENDNRVRQTFNKRSFRLSIIKIHAGTI